MNLVGLAQIFLGFFVERSFAARRAEVIGRTSGRRRVDIHMANGIMYSCCHKLVSFAEIIQHLEPIDKGQIAYTWRGLHPHGHGEHE